MFIFIFEKLGTGSYGKVFKGIWKGLEVAVKRFIRQNFEERLMLELRVETAMLSSLRHPNIVLFIGSCVQRNNTCVVSEYVERNLYDILHNHSVKLSLKRKLQVLRGVANGMAFLHSLDPPILHWNLKSSNVLVEEDWNAKVADVGFASIKEVHATMTKVEDPCWTGAVFCSVINDPLLLMLIYIINFSFACTVDKAPLR